MTISDPCVDFHVELVFPRTSVTHTWKLVRVRTFAVHPFFLNHWFLVLLAVASGVVIDRYRLVPPTIWPLLGACPLVIWWYLARQKRWQVSSSLLLVTAVGWGGGWHRL